MTEHHENIQRAKKIAKIRKSLGIGVTAFASKCGYVPTTIQRIEQLEYSAMDEVCEKICAVFGVNPK